MLKVTQSYYWKVKRIEKLENGSKVSSAAFSMTCLVVDKIQMMAEVHHTPKEITNRLINVLKIPEISSDGLDS